MEAWHSKLEKSVDWLGQLGQGPGTGSLHDTVWRSREHDRLQLLFQRHVRLPGGRMCGFTVLHGQYFGTRLTRKMFKIFLPLRTDSLKEELVSHTTLLETVSIVGQCKCMFFAHSQECSANTLESLTGASGQAVVLITFLSRWQGQQP